MGMIYSGERVEPASILKYLEEKGYKTKIIASYRPDPKHTDINIYLVNGVNLIFENSPGHNAHPNDPAVTYNHLSCSIEGNDEQEVAGIERLVKESITILQEHQSPNYELISQ